ncbi:hypothetical protein A3A84_01150 [Candidatus Collierbacteria bacterium RIFCSPLOWO2_01_FULL_50_23]|uniref:Uncharacterized protein n=2 Tax=Candidatus Collieribacteriota TaxID=1752725 RepID=A0A1F5EST5_9BACT|nr:MAG: hypothetical protein A3D09_00760 [Candidatus Collierbacteria bacterium RIFCSPHIGHO2_02_FULL_49_10]OGD72409.1 MAG: hypothetical protein A2703_00315 [Candidatus Collierbacteria bacterium RIFCSPHIGHO2_01_FULL_50_25]OGD74267.1 MAG: hypothetical protein A3A84_01150 [Candidatus Collierbacteria bacterium RIFCSPLOWO2_01_FULL_50_23]
MRFDDDKPCVFEVKFPRIGRYQPIIGAEKTQRSKNGHGMVWSIFPKWLSIVNEKNARNAGGCPIKSNNVGNHPRVNQIEYRSFKRRVKLIDAIGQVA